MEVVGVVGVEVAEDVVDGASGTWGILGVLAVASRFVHYKAASFEYNRHYTCFIDKVDYAVYL